jgi:hypothetical protein
MSKQSRSRTLFLKLTVFYVALFGLTSLAFYFEPDLGSRLPVGDIERFLTPGDNEPRGEFYGVEIQASQVVTEVDSMVWLVTAILGSVILMIPVSWTYLSIRRSHQMDQSLLQSFLILPIAVSGIVLLVHDSLALAFSLAGVVAGVRYRNTLKSTADSIFIFVAVGVGLAAGIGVLIVGAVMTLIFNYTLYVLWLLNYGRRDEAKHYMRRSTMDPDRGDEFENELTG